VALVAYLFLGGTQQLAKFTTDNGSGRSGSEGEVPADASHSPRAHEVLGFALIGVACGLLGAMFVTLVQVRWCLLYPVNALFGCVQGLTNMRNRLLDLKRNSKRSVDLRRYMLVAIVTLVVAILMYVENALTPSDDSLSVIDRIIAQRPVFRSAPLSLGMFFVYKMLITALSVTLPLPVGLFTPVFLTGGVLGRVIGELLTSLPGATSYASWEYSLIGAAAFSTGVVRAISTVVIVYEVSGQPHLLLPMSVAVLCAYFTGNRLTKNIYEVLMRKFLIIISFVLF
jgi:chloride channel 2